MAVFDPIKNPYHKWRGKVGKVLGMIRGAVTKRKYKEAMAKIQPKKAPRKHNRNN